MKIVVELPKRPTILKGLKPDERVKLDTMHYKRADAYVVNDDLFIYWQATFKSSNRTRRVARNFERLCRTERNRAVLRINRKEVLS